MIALTTERGRHHADTIMVRGPQFGAGDADSE
jgi:hypothetical protein